ncbi:MAG TPA: amidohydrolase family protein [Lysobacter sp.]|nr:amidohydrolase family protein [Lysobacter sp.]
MTTARALQGCARGLLAVVVSMLAAAPLPAREAAAAPVDVLVRDVTLIDVVDGKRHAHRDIALRDGRIVAITDSAAKIDRSARRIVDGRGKYAIPGLWDMHVHFGGGEKLIEENRALLPLYVAHGITAVRDAAGDLSPSVFRWRDAIAAGREAGPTIFTSGPKIEGRNSIWPGDIEIDSEAELDRALDRLAAERVDFIKITDNTLSPALFLKALEKVGARGMISSAHIPMAVSVAQASDAGLGSIEHIAYAYKAGVPGEAELSRRFAAGELDARGVWDRVDAAFDAESARAAYRRLARNGTAVTPTLNGSLVTAYLDRDDHAGDDYLKYIGPGLQATYAWRVERAAKDDAAAIARRHRRFEAQAAILPLLQEAGVTILAGTDAGFLNSFNYPGIALHEELALFVRYGLTPLQALQAATINGARFLRKDATHGSLAAGKAADVVLLEADPTQDIGAIGRIDTVILRGEVHDREALDRVLDEVRRRVAAMPPADA